MINVLITGTSGALGNELRKYFLHKGYNVIGTVGKSKPRENEIPINLGDWDSYAKLRKAADGVAAVVHNAAAIHGKVGIGKTYKANVAGTENMLRLAHECGCRNFIQISSVGVYGIHSLGKNRTEDTRPIDIEPYGITKKIAEKRIVSSVMPYTILRLPLVKYSGGYLIDGPIQKGVSVFVKKRELNIVSSVTPEYVAKTCQWIIENGPLNDIFNCASDHQTWRELVLDHCAHEKIEINNTKRVSIFGAFKMGIVIGPIALFGQHTPSDKLEHILSMGKL
ncbi:MAG: NAD-dependent epimerase/dehydratase family protein [Clostridia bacterium]|nr:NAD-dependent epimerase/dehydratase family protein [Clostridia bacterium]